MTLREWADLHRDDLKAESATESELTEYLALADRELIDAEAVVSSEGRLLHSHNACLALAAAALAACGFRVRKGSKSHHWRLVESLEYTLGLDAAKVKELQEYRRKRSIAVYERTASVSEVEADGAITAVRSLRGLIEDWLHRHLSDAEG
jgi:hypothetical protein